MRKQCQHSLKKICAEKLKEFVRQNLQDTRGVNGFSKQNLMRMGKSSTTRHDWLPKDSHRSLG